MNIKVIQYRKELDQQFREVDKIEDEEIKSMLVKFLCVRTSGLLENFIKSKISDYTDKKVPKEIKTYISGHFKDITSLNTKKIVNVLNSFSKDWAEDFKSYIEGHQQEKESLNSLITNRHNISHGQMSNITYNNIKQYYLDILSVMTKLDNIIR